MGDHLILRPSVVLSARTAAVIARSVDLRSLRQTYRSDSELDAELEAVQVAALLHEKRHVSGSGSAPPTRSETSPNSRNELSVDESAGALGVTGRRIRQLLAAGDLTGRRIGNTWIIDATSIDRYKGR